MTTRINLRQIGTTDPAGGNVNFKEEMHLVNHKVNNLSHRMGDMEAPVNAIENLPVNARANELRFVKEEKGFFTYDAEAKEWIQSSGGGNVNINQVTKLGVEASKDNPRVVSIPIEYTEDFKRLPIEVLKFIPGEDNIVKVVAEFNNGDQTDFDVDPEDETIIFDGTMRLKTEYEYDLVDEGELGDGRLYSVQLDLSKFKSIERIDIE